MLPFLSGTKACRCVVLPIYLGCHAQHFYSLHSSLIFSFTLIIMSNFTFVFFSPAVSSSKFLLFCFFSLMFFFCAVCAFHSPCHLVGLYLFIVICPVISIVAAVLNSISMFHVILIFISAPLLVLVLIALFISINFCAFLCASIILLSTTLF